MEALIEKNIVDSGLIQELFDDGYIRRVSGKTAELLHGSKVVASYPYWADAKIGFAERLVSVEDFQMRKTLGDFFQELEKKHYIEEISEQKIIELENLLTDLPMRELVCLGHLYTIACPLQKEHMINMFIDNVDKKFNIYLY